MKDALAIPGTLTERGLILVGDLPIKRWAELGERLGALGRATQWAIGDWICWGEDHYGEAHAQYVNLHGYAEQTLMNLASVARHVALAQRRPALSWSHHAEVTGQGPERQSELLEQAITEGWSSKRLRDVVKGTPGRSERASLAELGDTLVTAALALLRNLPPGAGGDLLRDCVWTAADAWLARRGKEPAR